MKLTGGTYFEALRIIGDNDYDVAAEVDRLLASDSGSGSPGAGQGDRAEHPACTRPVAGR